MDDQPSFGRWLRHRRRMLDLTQDELAQRVGCSVVTIRKIETDERRPSRQIAERLAASLQIPVEERAAFLQAARATLAVDRLPSPPLPASTTPAGAVVAASEPPAQPSPPPTVPPSTVCPTCGAAVAADRRFCGQCGTAIRQLCSACGVENPAGTRFCSACGAMLEVAAPVTALSTTE